MVSGQIIPIDGLNKLKLKLSTQINKMVYSLCNLPIILSTITNQLYYYEMLIISSIT